MRNTLIISIELDKLPLVIRNKIMSEMKKVHHKNYHLENQILKLSLNSYDYIFPILKEVR